MSKTEIENESKGLKGARPSIFDNGNGTQQTEPKKQESRMPVARSVYPIAVSQKQFESVETAHRDSINLLDSCGTVLLDAMTMAIPPKDSGRTVGEYTGQNLRQMAKSVCDIIQTKTGVVRSMYQISRDEM